MKFKKSILQIYVQGVSSSFQASGPGLRRDHNPALHVQHYRTYIKWHTIVHRAGKTESSVGHT